MATVVAQGHFTIVDTNDGYSVGAVAPTNPIANFTSWLDTSVTPNLLKKWSGTAWVVVNDFQIGGRNLLRRTEYFGIYNNFGVGATLVKRTDILLYGEPVYLLTMTPEAASLNDFKTNASNHGVMTTAPKSFYARLPYVVAIYWKPVSHADITVNLSIATNIGGWIAGGTVAVGDGWYRTLAMRDGTVTTDKLDNLYFAFYCPSAQAGVPISMYWACPQLEQANRASVWSPSPEDIQSNIDNIQVGGRNYIPHSGSLSSFSIAGNVVVSLGVMSSVNTGAYGNSDYLLQTIALIPNTQYTLSVQAWSDGASKLRLWAEIPSYYVDFDVNTTKKVYSISFNSGAYTSMRFSINNASTSANTQKLFATQPQLEIGNKVTDWKPAHEDSESEIQALGYLKDAMGQEAEFSGGLALLNLLLARNVQGDVRSGMSGLDDNIGFFSGGTYDQAVADVAKAFKSAMETGVLDRQDGGGHRAFGNFAWDLLGKVFVKGEIEATAGLFGLMKIIGGSIIGDHLKITNDPIETKAVATGAHTYTIPYKTEQENLSPAVPSMVMESDEVLFEQDTTITAYLRNNASFSLPSIFTDNTYSTVSVGLAFKLEVINNGVVVASNTSSWYAVGGAYTNSYSDGAAVVAAAISKGSVKLRSTLMINNPQGWDPTDYLIVHPIITSSNVGNAANVTFSANIYRTMMGIDGLFSFTGANRWLYYRGAGDSNDEFEVNMGGNKLGYNPTNGWNMPGVVAAGSVNSAGAKTNTWGIKSSSTSATKGGTGIYNVPHLAGSTFSVQVTPLLDNVIARVTSKGSNTFQVTIRNMSGTATDAGFEYAIFGSN